MTVKRWEIIQTALLRDIRSSRELEQAILTYNHKYAKEWKFKSLHYLFEKVSISSIVQKISLTLNRCHPFVANVFHYESHGCEIDNK